MKYLLTLLLFICTPVFACVHSIASTTEYVQVCAASDSCRTIFYSELPKGSKEKQAEIIRQELQDFLDVRLEITSFDPADSFKASDPKCESVYWGDNTGIEKSSLEATYIIARGCIVENVFWNLDRFTFTVRAAQPCL